MNASAKIPGPPVMPRPAEIQFEFGYPGHVAKYGCPVKAPLLPGVPSEIFRPICLRKVRRVRSVVNKFTSPFPTMLCTATFLYLACRNIAFTSMNLHGRETAVRLMAVSSDLQRAAIEPEMPDFSRYTATWREICTLSGSPEALDFTHHYSHALRTCQLARTR